MNIDRFLDNLEEQRFVKPEIVKKVREKIKKTNRKVTPESITNYLVNKGVLTKFQARQVLEEKIQEDLELNIPEEQAHDTDDLFQGFEEFRAKDPAPGATRTDTAAGLDQDHPEVELPEEVDVVEVEHDMSLQYGVEQGHAVFDDPLGDQSYDPMDSEADQPSPLGTFAGKKPVSNQWDSRWLFIGSGLLGGLILLGFILSYVLLRTDVDELWEAAQENFNTLRYQEAIALYDKFADTYPGDARAPLARVRIANCELRIPYDANRWDTALDRIKTVLPELQETLNRYQKPAEFEELRDELAVIIPGTAKGITEQALAANTIEEKEALLLEAEEANSFVNEAAYVPTSQKRIPGVASVIADLENNISLIKRQIQMEYDYQNGLSQIESLTNDGKTIEANEFYRTLTRDYPGLKVRQPLRDAMIKVSSREAELVQPIEFTTQPVAPQESPIQSSVMVATKTGAEQIAGLSDEMLVWLVNGAVCGIRAANGEIVWRHYVGLETQTPPQWLDPNQPADVIAVDARHHHLMRVNAQTGEIVWNVSLGEPFADPSVVPASIVVTTLSGKLVVIDPSNGSALSAAQLPQTANLSGVVKDNFILQVGNHSNVYLISAEDMNCRYVYYTGHDPNTIAIPPFVFSGHIVIAENGASYCNLHVLKVETTAEEGPSLVQAQPPMRLNGQVNSAISRYNRWGLVLTDDGDFRMLEINLAAPDTPLTKVAQDRFGRNDNQQPRYVFAEGGFLWIMGSGMRHFKIQRQIGEFKPLEHTNNLDLFLGPAYKYGDTLFHIRQRDQSALVSVSAIDATNHQEIWRTDFSAPLAGPPIVSDQSMHVVSSQGDLFKVDDQALANGSLSQPISRGSTVVQNLVFNQILAVGPQNYVATGPLARTNILSLDMSQQAPSKLSQLEPPADQRSCNAVTFGDSLLVPSLRGQVFRINPRSGQAVGAPFQPPLQPNVDVVWREPAVITDGEKFLIADQSGRFFLVTADADRSLQKVDEYQHSGSVLSSLIVAGDSVVAICREQDGDKVVSIPNGDKIEIEKSIDLQGGWVAGPMRVSDGFLVLLDTGHLVMYDAELNQRWRVEMPADKLAGNPTISDGQIMLSYQSGVIHFLDGQTGEIRRTIELGQPIAHAPTLVDGRMFADGADGTLYQVKMPD